MGAHYVRLASDYIYAVQSRLEYCVTPWRKMMHAAYSSLPPGTKHPSYAPYVGLPLGQQRPSYTRLCREPVTNKRMLHKVENRNMRSGPMLRDERGECPEDYDLPAGYHLQLGQVVSHFIGAQSFGPTCCNTTKILGRSSRVEPREQLYKQPSPFSLKALRDVVRSKYFSTSKPALHLFEQGRGTTVAMHIRGGDAHRTATGAKEWPLVVLGNRSKFVNGTTAVPRCLRFLKRLYGPSTQLHVFSESPVRPIANEDSINWHVDGDPYSVFHHLVMADVLVVAYGTFGLMAGYLNIGSVYTYAQRNLSVPNFAGTCMRDVSR